MNMAEILSLISAVRNIANSRPINGDINLTPNHFLKNSWILLKGEELLDTVQTDLSTSLSQIFQASGEAQSNLVEILRRGWMINPKHHQLGAEKKERFQCGDIVLYVADHRQTLGRITKVHGNYSTVLISEKGAKTKHKNIHDRFLIFLLRTEGLGMQESKTKDNADTDTTNNVTTHCNRAEDYNTGRVGQLIISLGQH